MTIAYSDALKNLNFYAATRFFAPTHLSVNSPIRRLPYALHIGLIHRITGQLNRRGIAGRVNWLGLGFLLLTRLSGLMLHDSVLLPKL